MTDKKDFENKYSRQIGAYGMETMGKLIQMEVFLYGLRGLGIETAKNIILAGPKRVVLCDPNITTLADLGSNFYLKESDVGKTRRDEASISLLKELNPRVEVELANFDPHKEVEKLKQFNVVTFTEIQKTDYLNKVDEITRSNNAALIYAVAAGLSGFIFTDFGKEFIIKDENGEPCKQYIVKSISNGNPGVVLIDDTVGGKLAFTDGDYVAFREVQGMFEVNDTPPRPIKYISPFAFSIEETTKYGEYTTGGIVEQIKVPKPYHYRTFSDCFETPYTANAKIPDPIDFAKFGRNELLHIAVQVLHKFYEDNGVLPKPNDCQGLKSYVELAKANYQKGKDNKVNWINNSQEFDEKIIYQVLTWAKCHIVPITSFMGGIVAQEIVKYTGKYTPIDQWLWFEFFESVENVPETANRSPLNSRYDDQIAIYGREIQEKLENLNIFMIGAGALGCEFLKEFALMGISTKNGLTVVTDNDHIEISNLNRQFLFRINDIRKAKSEVACRVVKQYNKDFKTDDRQALVAAENSHIFNDKFWESQDFVINAVDNIKARKYIDNMCTWYSKPLIDSGTLGTKAHSQVIYPHVTSCYNDMQDPPEEGVPMCTLHNFPSMIEHCIEYGRDSFTGNFTDAISEAKKFVSNSKSFLTDLRKEGNTTVQIKKLNNIKELIVISKSKDFNKCIQYAFNCFVDLFDHKIRQLLYNFPADYVDNNGAKFWTGSKRVPSPITFNVEDELSFTYVSTFATILAQTLNIPIKDFSYIKDFCSKLKIPEFVPQKVSIKVSETDNNDNNDGMMTSEEEENKLNDLMSELTLKEDYKAKSEDFIPQDFEKDDDSNNHVDFIHSLSNLRAQNYRINQCDRLKTKLIAGKIIPALATTTASITGLVAIQILTLLQTNKLDFMRGAYINSAVNLYNMTEPGPKIVMQDKEMDPILFGPVKAVPSKWSVWDRIDINTSMTFKELIDHFDKTYDVEVNIVACGKITLLLSISPSFKEKMNRKIEDEYATLNKTENEGNYLVLEIGADCKDGATALMPLVKYKYKQ